MRNRREMLRSGAAALLLAGPGIPLGAGAAHAAGDAAVALVETLIASFQEALKQPDVRGRAALLAEPLATSFDLPAMLRLAIGTRWKDIPADKQAALTEAFGPYLTATYATRLSAAAGSKFAVQPKSEARGQGRLVQSTVTDPSGDASPVDYVIGPDGKITDVFLQGTVSEAGTLRTGFGEPLKEGGPDALLAHLRKTTETMLAARPSKP
ncbi:MAG: ABC transporter substrate-binding protein [Methylobacterium frigidaeris]